MKTSDHTDAPAFGMMTIFDEIAESHPIPIELTSGAHESFVVFDGVSRGVAVLARFAWWKAMLGFKLDPHEGDVAVTLNVTLDDVAHAWWGRKFTDLGKVDSRRVRHVVILAQGDVVGGFTVAGEEQKISHTFVMRGDLAGPGGLLMLELVGFDGTAFEGPTNIEPLQGLQLDSISIAPATSVPGPQVYVDAAGPDSRTTPQGSVVTRDEPARVGFRVVERPPLSPAARSSALGKTIGRGVRKAGVVGRGYLRRSGRFARDSEAVQQAFRVDAFRPDHSTVDVGIAMLDDDVIELTFPAAPEGAQVVFFELGTREPHLARLGYSTSVQFERVY
jgi:hypothetical protein